VHFEGTCRLDAPRVCTHEKVRSCTFRRWFSRQSLPLGPGPFPPGRWSTVAGHSHCLGIRRQHFLRPPCAELEPLLCGSDEEFDAAAAEFLSFVRMNVRSRILRRFPLTAPARCIRRLLGKSNRKLTRTGLLEREYAKFLYGGVSLFELPQSPKLHILATNLSEGCLCSFSRDGLSMVRRQRGHYFRRNEAPASPPSRSRPSRHCVRPVFPSQTRAASIIVTPPPS
jgi:hypothetical protein